MAVNKLVSLPQKMFKVEKVNCICVDWEHGAWTEYTQAVHNTRVVGAEIAFFVQGLSVNPCPGHMLWGGGREGARSAPQGTQRQPGDPWGQAELGSQESRKAFASGSCKLPSLAVLKIRSCEARGRLASLSLSFPF